MRLRRASVRLASACALVLLVVAAASGAAASGRPGLDRSYGKAGIVRVPSPVPPAPGISHGVDSYGVARDGSAYADGTVYECASSPCTTRAYLLRFRPDGSQDTAFGGGGTVFLQGTSRYQALVADRSGRAVVGEVREGSVVLSRFDLNGAPDESFGHGGTVELPCGCSTTALDLLPTQGGGIVAIASKTVTSKHFESIATRIYAFDLLPDGREDQRFGRAGEAAFKIPKFGELESTALTPDGMILFGGSDCCGDHPGIWLWGVRADGRSARRFNREAAGSLRRLGPPGDFPYLTSILARPSGAVEVLGSKDGERSFLLRLRGTGKAVAGFGRRGAVPLPFDAEASDAGVHGAVFVVARRGYYGYSVFRILAHGRLDPAYGGAEGTKLTLPGQGVEVRALEGGRALVTDLGYFECRGSCPAKPSLARFVE
jgi:hypothetical protein